MRKDSRGITSLCAFKHNYNYFFKIYNFQSVNVWVWVVLFYSPIILCTFSLEQDEIITRCIQALEECVRRFPEHYKSLYRMAHFYFRSKYSRDVAKVHKLLLNEGGLFADRKPANFFNVSHTYYFKLFIN